MSTILDDIESKYPTGLDKITLGQWISFTNNCKDIDKEQAEILQLPDGNRKSIRLTTNQVSRAYLSLAFFTGIDIDKINQGVCVDDALMYYRDKLLTFFDNIPPVVFPLELFDVKWVHPHHELTPSNPMTFGELIDGKIVAQAAALNEQSKWELLQYICAIYLRHPGEEYSEAFIDENNDRFKLMAQLPMHIAMDMLIFFEELNKYIEEHFSVFHETEQKEGKAMKEHFKQWGWVNFLKTIAKTKVYDIPNSGLNSIDCARRARCYDVLIDASEEKDYNIAAGRDLEALYKKQ